MEILGIFKNSSDGKSFSTGEVIFEQGSEAENMFVVKKGQVEIIVNNIVIDIAEEGQIFGEMALIDNKQRSATVKAKTDCEVVPIDKKRFTFLVQQTPYFAIYVMKVMAARIRNMDSKI